MVENISKIQQLLTESKFVEAQNMAETQLFQSKGSDSTELLELYFESLKSQNKNIPDDLYLSLIEKLVDTNPEGAIHWLGLLPHKHIFDQQRLLLIKIKLAEAKGKLKEVYNLISQFQMTRFESRLPLLPEVVIKFSEKYFQNDYHLQLQRLALDLMRWDLASSEERIKELILYCFERTSPKGTKEKLNNLYKVLQSEENLHHLELYKNFCALFANGITQKKDFKKVIELVIYFEDFRMQTLILDYIMSQGWNDIAEDYSKTIKQNNEYNYVYFDKFLPHLKSLFFQRKKDERPEPLSLKVVELKADKFNYQAIPEEMYSAVSEEEFLLAHVLKHQNFSTSELLDIAIGFVQSDFNYAALMACELAYNSTTDEEVRLKVSYLKVTCFLKNGDYRAALDISLEALSLAKTQNDLLSFLYSQGEAHLRLNEFEKAKRAFKKIMTIDSGYRLTKERLESLNAI